MPNPASSNHCLRHWDLADHIRIDDAISLWRRVEPAELAKLNFETQCMSAKLAALLTALRNGRLDYEDLGRRLSILSGRLFRAGQQAKSCRSTYQPTRVKRVSRRRWLCG